MRTGRTAQVSISPGKKGHHNPSLPRRDERTAKVRVGRQNSEAGADNICKPAFSPCLGFSCDACLSGRQAPFIFLFPDHQLVGVSTTACFDSTCSPKKIAAWLSKSSVESVVKNCRVPLLLHNISSSGCLCR